MAAPAHRLFYALRPPPLVRNRIGWHRDQLGTGAGTVRNDRLHMTIGITDDFAHEPVAEAERLMAIAARIAAEPLAIRLDRVSGSNASIALRPSRRLPGLSDLAGQLQRLLDGAGLLRAGWRFNPHVTLLYRDGRPFSRGIDPIGWDAQEFVLIHSLLGATRHIELGRWPLVRRQGSFGF